MSLAFLDVLHNAASGVVLTELNDAQAQLLHDVDKMRNAGVLTIKVTYRPTAKGNIAVKVEHALKPPKQVHLEDLFGFEDGELRTDLNEEVAALRAVHTALDGVGEIEPRRRAEVLGSLAGGLGITVDELRQRLDDSIDQLGHEVKRVDKDTGEIITTTGTPDAAEEPAPKKTTKKKAAAKSTYLLTEKEAREKYNAAP